MRQLMAQREIEVILARQLANYLALPVFLADTEGNLIFYNEPAERILGRRFEDTGEMPAAEWSTLFHPEDPQGRPLPAERLPLVQALTLRRPAHDRYWIQGLDGARRMIEVTAFPLIGMAGRFLGGLALFWETVP
jgi:PAS domain-containing protein